LAGKSQLDAQQLMQMQGKQQYEGNIYIILNKYTTVKKGKVLYVDC